MSKFKLDNFISKSEDNEEADIFPDFIEDELRASLIDWQSRATEKQSLSLKVLLENYQEIANKIELKIDLKINERKIILSRVASIAQVDKSYLTKRRTPELYKLTISLNTELERLWKLKPRRSKVTQLTKKELNSELTKMKKELKSERDKNLGLIISELLNNKIYSDKKALAEKNAELENTVVDLQKKNAQLRVLLKSHNLKIIKD